MLKSLERVATLKDQAAHNAAMEATARAALVECEADLAVALALGEPTEKLTRRATALQSQIAGAELLAKAIPAATAKALQECEPAAKAETKEAVNLHIAAAEHEASVIEGAILAILAARRRLQEINRDILNTGKEYRAAYGRAAVPAETARMRRAGRWAQMVNDDRDARLWFMENEALADGE